MIGTALRSIRNIYGLSAKEVSDSIGISPSFLSEVESGKKTPTLETLEKLSALYEIRVSTLLYIAEEIKDDSVTSGIRKSMKEHALSILRRIEMDSAK